MESQLDELNRYEIMVEHYEDNLERWNDDNTNYLSSVLDQLYSMKSSKNAQKEEKERASSLYLRLASLPYPIKKEAQN